jgi:hypothetical protein
MSSNTSRLYSQFYYQDKHLSVNSYRINIENLGHGNFILSGVFYMHPAPDVNMGGQGSIELMINGQAVSYSIFILPVRDKSGQNVICYGFHAI